jgi:hypothetical protein
MGCAASSQPADGNRAQSPTAGRTSTVGGETRTSEDRQHGEGADAARGAQQSRGDHSTGGNAVRDGSGGQGVQSSSQAPQAVAAFTTHIMVDSRGAKVSTVIQNKSKVETLCKWADNVLKARAAAGGTFSNPQDGRARRNVAAASTQDQTSVAGDTASVSSRHNAAANSRTEYGSMASNGGLLGVSTTAHGATTSQSRGNLTMIAHRGSDEEDPQLSPTRVDADDAPLPSVQ